MPADGNSENSSNEDQVDTDSDNHSDSDEENGPEVVNAVEQMEANGPNHIVEGLLCFCCINGIDSNELFLCLFVFMISFDPM